MEGLLRNNPPAQNCDVVVSCWIFLLCLHFPKKSSHCNPFLGGKIRPAQEGFRAIRAIMGINQNFNEIKNLIVNYFSN